MQKLVALLTTALLGSAAAAPLSLTLSLTDGQTPFLFDSALKVAGQDLTVQEVKFYVSDVALVRADGTEVPVRGLSLAQLKKGTTPQNIEIFKGEAPAGTYRGLRFNVGVPRALNHADATTAKAPLSLEQGMYWAWNSGYIFFTLLGESNGVKVANHVGGDSHRITVDLTDLQKPGTALRVAADGGLTVPVSLDLQKLYAAGVGGAWDFSRAQYQQVHFGPVADQFYANVAGAFSRADGANANPVYRGAPAPAGAAAPTAPAMPAMSMPAMPGQPQH
ncbi:MbnP family protein [Deinococcus sp. PESE-13]